MMAPMVAEQPELVPVSMRTEARRVEDALEQMCDDLGPGGRIPVRADLMRRFDASERSVLRALDELHRRGRIDRRVGAGTFVRECPTTPNQSVVAPATDGKTVVAIAEPDNSFFAYGMQQLYRHADAARLSLVGRMVDSESLEKLDLDQFGAPLGFILLRRSLAPLAERLLALGHRAVMIGSLHAGAVADFPRIHGDHEHGGYLAAHHLIELGHRHVAFAAIGDDLQKSLRWLGHQQAIEDAPHAGIRVKTSVLTGQEFRLCVSSATETSAYFRRLDAPTAIVAWNDAEAVALLTALLHAGLRVPADISVIGYDNLPEGEMISPRLTTVDQHLSQQLRIALRLLTQPTPAPANQMILTVPSLVSRASTASPPTDG